MADDMQEVRRISAPTRARRLHALGVVGGASSGGAGNVMRHFSLNIEDMFWDVLGMCGRRVLQEVEFKESI